MAQYMIVFDPKKVASYKGLHDQLTAWKAETVRGGVWLADLAGPANEIADLLKPHVDKDDTLCVMQLKSGIQWHTWSAPKQLNDWMLLRFPKPF